MAHESFEDAATAAYLNAHFVAVKVDREERPDVDAVYMEATQALTGHGGWPMTVFPTPDGRAVLLRHLLPAGAAARHAVVPPAARVGRRRPGAERRDEVVAARPAHRRAAWPSRPGRRPTGTPAPDADRLDAAVRSLAAHVRRAARRVRRRPEVPAVDGAGVPAAPPRAHRGRRGAADGRGHLRGDGPRRDLRPARPAASRATPSTPAGWCRTSRRCCTTTRCCCGSTRTCGARPGRRWPGGSPARPPTGCSATCAPPRAASPRRWTPTREGVEGLTYVWTPAQLVEVLGAGRRRVGRRPVAGHRGGHLRARQRRRCSCRATPTTTQRWDRRPRRGCSRPGTRGRSRPGTTRWSRPGTGWPSPRWPRPARCSTGRTWSTAATGGRRPAAAAAPRRRPAAPGVPRRSGRRARRRPGGLRRRRRGAARAATPSPATRRWLRRAGGLLDVVLARFADGAGGFYDTADDRDDAALRRCAGRRTRPTTPPRPGRSAAAGALLTYAAYTGSARHREAAERALGVYGRLAERTRGSPAGGSRSPRRWSTARARWPWSGRPVTRRPGDCTGPRCWAPPRARRWRWAIPTRSGSTRAAAGRTGPLVDGRARGVRLPALRLRRADRPTSGAALAAPAAASAHGEHGRMLWQSRCNGVIIVA